MNVQVANYAEQIKRWPKAGQHILAQYDDRSIIVYQAYRPSIGRFALENGCFGGDFKYSRMSWIKPNFLWMMYRSSWGTAEGQEVVLALRLRRSFFDSLLAAAVPSTFSTASFESREAWQKAVERSNIRMQWDPDHTPTGEPCQRRAIQLGLRGQALENFGKREILEVIDLTEFVAAQRANATSRRDGELLTPDERVYLPADAAIAQKVAIDR
ncbi:MAG TPA: DUF4291 domain-containing protein [Pirellulales bacterium]|nr:DUF4291 domain-containing protein [Pirellulales bacterium]